MKPMGIPSFGLLLEAREAFISGHAEQASVWTLSTKQASASLSASLSASFLLYSGAEALSEAIQDFSIPVEQFDQLGGLIFDSGEPIFDGQFLAQLEQFRFSGNLDALAEGTVAFADMPIIRVEAPYWQGVLLEAILSQTIQPQTQIATRAAHLRRKLKKGALIEDMAISCTNLTDARRFVRAAYVGGCDATTHIYAADSLGIPLRSFLRCQNTMPTGPNGDILLHATEAQQVRDQSQSLRKQFSKQGFEREIIANAEIDPDELAAIASFRNPPTAWRIADSLAQGLPLQWRYECSAIKSSGAEPDESEHFKPQPNATLPGRLQAYLNKKGQKLSGITVKDLDDEKPPKGAPMLETMFRDGNCFYFPPSLESLQQKSLAALQQLPGSGHVPVVFDR